MYSINNMKNFKEIFKTVGQASWMQYFSNL